MVFKKGNAVIDTITILVVLVVFAIMIIVFKMMFSNMNTDIQADPDITADAKAMIATENNRFANFWDQAFLYIFILIWAMFLVASYMIDSHPIFFFFSLLALIAVFIAAAHLGNAYEEIMLEDEFVAVIPEFPIMNWIMTHLLQVIVVVGFSLLTVLYAKNRNQT